jgi:hypothetical protein
MTGIIVPIEYACYPTGYNSDDLDHLMNVRSWTLTIERRGPGAWAVCRPGQCMNRRGGWTHEGLPSSRGDRFKRAYRFDLKEAQDLALRWVDRQRVNGMTWQQFLDRLEASA